MSFPKTFLGGNVLNGQVSFIPNETENQLSLSLRVKGDASATPTTKDCNIHHYYIPKIDHLDPLKIDANEHDSVKIDQLNFGIRNTEWGVNPSDIGADKFFFYTSEVTGGTFRIRAFPTEFFDWQQVLDGSINFKIDDSNNRPHAMIQLGHRYFNSSKVNFPFNFTPRDEFNRNFEFILNNIIIPLASTIGVIALSLLWREFKKFLQKRQKGHFMDVLSSKQKELLKLDSGENKEVQPDNVKKIERKTNSNQTHTIQLGTMTARSHNMGRVESVDHDSTEKKHTRLRHRVVECHDNNNLQNDVNEYKYKKNKDITQSSVSTKEPQHHLESIYKKIVHPIAEMAIGHLDSKTHFYFFSIQLNMHNW
jgi:hypothetical protein